MLYPSFSKLDFASLELRIEWSQTVFCLKEYVYISYSEAVHLRKSLIRTSNSKMNIINESNSTSNADSRENSGVPVTEIVLVIFALILSAFIISVNSITIFLIKTTQCLRTLSNIYVMSLAMTDLVVGLGLIPLSLFYVPSIRIQYYDQNIKLCVLVLGINLGMAVVSTIHMALIATDRYFYIIRPYFYQKVISRKIIYIILSSTWSFGIFFALLPQLIHNEAPKFSRCDITLAMPIEYLFYSTMSLYILCIIVDLTFYSQILYTAYTQRRIIQSTAIVDSCRTSRTTSVAVTQTSRFERPKQSEWNISSIVHPVTRYQNNIQDPSIENRIACYSTPKLSSRIKNVRFFMTVFGVYFFCVTPTVVCIGTDYYCTIPRFVYNMFNLLALLNSGMNFIIFFVLNAQFRMCVLRLFRCKKAANIPDPTDASYFDG